MLPKEPFIKTSCVEAPQQNGTVEETSASAECGQVTYVSIIITYWILVLSYITFCSFN